MNNVAAVLDFLFERMSIDPEWAVRDTKGFTWWAGELAQRVTAAKPREVDGVQMTTLHITTDLVMKVPQTALTWERLAGVNRLASMSAYVGDTKGKSIKLHASVSMTDDNWPMARALALHAMALQVADAHAEVDELAQAFEGKVARTAHPTSGPRQDRDEMLSVVDIYEDRGADPSPFSTEELAELVHLDPRPWLMASSEAHTFVADLDFADGKPARLELDASVEHPALGSGLQMLLMLPVEADAAIAQRLNASELVEPDSHQLGGWGLDEERGLVFAAFIPAAAHMPELSRALVYHLAARNQWARALLFPAA